MLFQLPEIDREATKKKVEAILDNYRVVLLQVPDDLLPKVTAGFNLVPPSNTNAFHSSTEDTAIRRIEMEQKRNVFLAKIQKAVNRLPVNERQIIIMRYMSQDHRFDYEVYNEIGLSPRTYFRIKSRAFYNLAFALKEEVYVKGSAS
ncbi:ArpU family transcriptional regulator [Bacillus haynesii]|uniref:ArpU family phage packaging/lysis transcriptional regulator n=1 Tax=Bacillus haynesii TaxID=1925021 RepID=UPI00227F2E95|nr:ArpU family phage packaging/lysis transcriptional regulator [Bacillus haynesii]MCY8011270.1 ArpU family transcriptional regulator [Bacillus haynesii]